jgi:D-sedoheptulose 7-phosphate isomerase
VSALPQESLTAPGIPEGVTQLRSALDGFTGQAAMAWSWGRDLAELLYDGGRLLVAGNGGSAAQAQHLTAELVGRFERNRPAYSAICLSAETSSLTAIANDFGAAELFARQVVAHGRPGDVLIVLSTSGTSANIIRAAESARERGLLVWALSGSRPTALAFRADQVLSTPDAKTSTIQELHLLAIHCLCAGFDAREAQLRGAA